MRSDESGQSFIVFEPQVWDQIIYYMVACFQILHHISLIWCNNDAIVRFVLSNVKYINVLREDYLQFFIISSKIFQTMQIPVVVSPNEKYPSS